MNKSILLVMKWLNDHSSVPQRELEQNSVAAATYAAADAATYAAADAATYAAAGAAADAATYAAARWVDRYFTVSGEDRQQYIYAVENPMKLAEATILQSRSEPVAPAPKGCLAPTKSVSYNLATKIAWLEGFSVASECTGEQYCEIARPGSCHRVKYDPIGRPAIIQLLIQKYKVNLNWLPDGNCNAGKYDGTRSYKYVNTTDHNGCLATTVLTAILKDN